jgi:Single cache domain 3
LAYRGAKSVAVIPLPSSFPTASTTSKLLFILVVPGKAYYGEVPILGTPYTTGYEPIKDSSGAQIGIYCVGYKK